MEALKSGSVIVESKTKIDTGLFPIETDVVVTGDFLAPDRSRFTVNISSSILSAQYEAIVIGQEAYQKLPFSDEWEPGPDALAFLGAGRYLGQINLNFDSETVQMITLVGSEVLEGDSVFSLEGSSLPATAIALLTGDPTLQEDSGDSTGDVQIWIGTEDSLVRKLYIEYQMKDSPLGGDLTVETVVYFSSYDKEVDIQAP